MLPGSFKSRSKGVGMMLASWCRMQTFNTVQSEPAITLPPKNEGSAIEANAESTRDEEDPRDKYDLCYLACTD
jgi:hypothetical protein